MSATQDLDAIDARLIRAEKAVAEVVSLMLPGGTGAASPFSGPRERARLRVLAPNASAIADERYRPPLETRDVHDQQPRSIHNQKGWPSPR